ncbi:MAG: fibronectin type III domain-containing protein [Roseburia sp. 1XD42-69]
MSAIFVGISYCIYPLYIIIKTISLTWKKDTKASGYEIQCNTNKKFKSGNKTVTVKKAKTTSAKISKLKSGKKYYVRMRAYKTIEGKRYAGSWSKVLTVKVK